MKNLLKRTWWQAILLSLVVLVVSGGIVYAAYYGVSKTLAATVTVAEVVTLPSDAIGVYSDPTGTANVTSLNFGRVAPPGWGYRQTSVTVYVRNSSNETGPEPMKLFISAYGQDFNYGSVWVDSVYNQATSRWEYPSVLPGQIIPVKINLNVDSNAPVGSHNFTVVIEGKAATSPDVMPPMYSPSPPVVVVPVPSNQYELSNIQSATITMMVDNNIASLDTGDYGGPSTNNMALFPDPGVSGNTTNKYVLFGFGGNATINYVATQNTTKYYTVNAQGTVKQWDGPGLGP